MKSRLHYGTACAVALLAATLGACAASAPKSASVRPGKANANDIGLATRAQMALMNDKPAEAVPLAERAVALNDRDTTVRTLLGNCYFAAGRFASAEAAYRDSLTLQSNQPPVILKMVLVSIAQGKNDQALALLDAARNVLDPSDYGLAMALAGKPADAAQILRQAAEAVGADSRVRQNLALALALSGDWVGARSVAAQDITPDQLDARIQSWMQMAKPSRPSDQVAALTGVVPAALDPGQPVRLALKENQTRLAANRPLPAVTEQAPALVTVPARQADLTPASVTPVRPAVAAPMMAATAVPASAPVALASAPTVNTAAVSDLPEMATPTMAALVPARKDLAPRPSLSPRAAALTVSPSLVMPASFVKGRQRSRAVVQLGAYADRARVDAAWRRAAARFASLRGFSPVAARYDGERGTVYRLAIQGFGSTRQAADLCGSLKRAGATCFVRYTAGDRPVQLASR